MKSFKEILKDEELVEDVVVNEASIMTNDQLKKINIHELNTLPSTIIFNSSLKNEFEKEFIKAGVEKDKASFIAKELINDVKAVLNSRQWKNIVKKRLSK